jgi:hypothetical protein
MKFDPTKKLMKMFGFNRDSSDIPTIVEETITYLENNGADTEEGEYTLHFPNNYD